MIDFSDLIRCVVSRCLTSGVCADSVGSLWCRWDCKWFDEGPALILSPHAPFLLDVCWTWRRLYIMKDRRNAFSGCFSLLTLYELILMNWINKERFFLHNFIFLSHVHWCRWCVFSMQCCLFYIRSASLLSSGQWLFAINDTLAKDSQVNLWWTACVLQYSVIISVRLEMSYFLCFAAFIHLIF